MQINSVCVLGGSGFVGNHITCRLVDEGYSVRVLTRNRDRSKHLTVMPGVSVIDADIFSPQQLQSQFKNADTVINLVGILNEKQHNGEGFHKAHAELPRIILDACKTSGIKRIIHMSALNADAEKGSSHYLRSKGEGENILHTSSSNNIKVTSFRPSVIFGPDDSFFNRFAGFLKITPLAFPLACADARFAPVYVGDVAQRFVDAIKDKNSYGQKYDLCGPKEYSLKQLLEYTCEQLGIKRQIIGLPDFFSRLQANMLEWFPGKPFSIDNYNSLKIDSICQGNHCEKTSIESIVPYYLGNRGTQKHFAQYRSKARR